jgi:hypothetical protein
MENIKYHYYAILHWEHEKINKDNVFEILNILINNKFDTDILKTELENYLYNVL